MPEVPRAHLLRGAGPAYEPPAGELRVGPPHEGCRAARARPRHPQRVVGEDVVGPRFEGDGRRSVGLGEVGDLPTERLLGPGGEQSQDDDVEAEAFRGGRHDVMRWATTVGRAGAVAAHPAPCRRAGARAVPSVRDPPPA